MVVRHLKYTITSDTSQKASFINLAKDLSAINRQLFRQCRTYKVKSITMVDDDEAKFVQFGMVPDTWAMRNAVKRGFKRWNEMNKQVLKQQPSLKARWNDFKIYASPFHQVAEEVTNPTYTLETPEDMSSNKLKYGEWNYSTFESPDGTSSVDGYEVGILGGHTGSAGNYTYVGLIQSYGDARGTVNNIEPNVNAAFASDDPLVNLLDAGTQFDEIAENIIQEGDKPPYYMDLLGRPGQSYVGAADNMPQSILFGELNASTDADGLQRIYNVELPLGVMRVDHQTEAGATNFTLIVELAEGNYKGIHSESMV